jgi:uncharacterized protein YjbI with pentapeptide repeats
MRMMKRAVLACSLLLATASLAQAGAFQSRFYESTGYYCENEQGRRGRNRIQDLEVLDLLADASCSDLRGLVLAGKDLSGKTLSASLFPHALTGANFDGANLGGAEWDEKSLAGARLNGAYVDHAHASFAGFDGALAADAKFFSSDLHNATFRGADLRRANFIGSDLRSAIFDDADLRGTDLGTPWTDGASFAGARFDAATKLQFSREEAERRGMIFVGP